MKKTILAPQLSAIVIDDNRQVHTDFVAMVAADKRLERLKIIKCFTTCRAALRFLKKHGPVDVVFCDIELKDENGIKEAAKFFDDTAFFLLITVHEQFMREAWKSGVHGYIVKPINTREIHQKLNDLDRIRKSGRIMEDPDKTVFIKDAGADAPTKIKLGCIRSITVDSNRTNYLLVDTTQGVYHPLASLSSYKKRWVQTGLFVQLNQRTLVSILHVARISEDLVYMANGTVFRASRRNIKALAILQDYLDSHEKGNSNI